jgi:hypothetical protein
VFFVNGKKCVSKNLFVDAKLSSGFENRIDLRTSIRERGRVHDGVEDIETVLWEWIL